VQAAVAIVPGASATKVTEQQMEITLPAGSSQIVIVQTVTKDSIPGNLDDASWAPGTQLQVDWLLSSAPVNGALVEIGGTVDSKWKKGVDGLARPTNPLNFTRPAGKKAIAT
jgi:hypothetical protein